MFKLSSFILGALLLTAGAAQSANIVFDKNPDRWTIMTDNSSYQVIIAPDSALIRSYFGPMSGTRTFDVPGEGGAEHVDHLMPETQTRGGFIEATPSIEVVFPDGVRELELVYIGADTGIMDGYPYIRIDMKDSFYPLAVSKFIRIIPELDIYEMWTTLKNNGKDPIVIEKAASGSVVLPQNSYDLIQLSGNWGREFYPRRSNLTSGIKTLDVKGMKSPQHAPFFMVRPSGDTEESTGPVWFGEVAWSGNWQLDFDVNRMEKTQISGGINFWDTTWNLKGGTEFTTPKIIMGVSTDGTAGASIRLHRYYLDHVMPKPYSRKVSRILYNSWEATTFDVNQTGQVELAKIAKDLGVELFVMDDGWFEGRNDDHAGLGDWTPDKKKFPNGLAPLIKEVNALGMDFGIWVEPEMVNPNSDLFRKHPDWALHTPHRKAHEQRTQLVLNFARDDVKEYTIKWLDDLLSKNNIKFIKWDMNRQVSENGWPEADIKTQRELRIRYVNNLYEVFRTMRERHPDVVFESCSSGGGRVDPGILSLTDEVWTSDNTDPGDRLQIQYGFSHAFPAKAMMSWVTDSDWHASKPSLRFRFLVSMAGNLAIGSDLRKFTEDDKKIAREMISKYKEVRHIVQLGDQYRLRNPFEENRMAVQFVTRDCSESVVYAFQTLETEKMATKASSTSNNLVLKGLDPKGIYALSGDTEKAELSGDILMKSGVSVPLKGNYTGKMIVLKKK